MKIGRKPGERRTFAMDTGVSSGIIAVIDTIMDKENPTYRANRKLAREAYNKPRQEATHEPIRSEPPRSTGGFYARRVMLTKGERLFFQALHGLLPEKDKPKTPLSFRERSR